MFSLQKEEGGYKLFCDDVLIGNIQLNNGRDEDFVCLNKYFTDLKNKDFEITAQEVHDVIRKKIGDSIYNEFCRNFVEEDERIVFFAWSIGGNDYAVLTNYQVITVDKNGCIGNNRNVKKYFYEDIISMEAIQNTSDGSLMGDLLDTAFAAAFKDCNLKINVRGSSATLNAIRKIEADKAIEICDRMRMTIRNKDRDAIRNPQVVVVGQQQSSQPDLLEQLEKLSKLKEAGILSEEEFNQKKADLLSRL